jgi:MYXO-CTERM domain-containing protein
MNKLQSMMVGMLFATQAFADRAPANPPPASTPASTPAPVAKEPEKPMTSGPVAKAETPKTADTKTGGCAVDPTANASAMFGLLAVGVLLRRKKSGR